MRWALLILVAIGFADSLFAEGLQTLDRDLARLRGKYKVPGMSAVVADRSGVIWEKAFGEAEIGVKPATSDTVFHLASLTKPFAAVVLLQLVEEGKLNLDAKMSDFGVTFTNSAAVTVRHVLSHTSEGEPGQSFKYNGARFRRLDNVISNVTGRTFAQEVQALVWAKLGLANTAPNPEDAKACEQGGRDAGAFKARLAQGYASDGKTPIKYRDGFSVSAGMVSTARDIARFSQAWDRNELLRAETKEMAWQPSQNPAGKPLAYGLGWFICESRKSGKIVWHYGWWDGVSSLIVKVPAKELTFVLLANSDMLSRPFDLGGDNNVRRSKFAEAFLDAFGL